MKRRRNKDRGGGGNSKKRQKKDPEVSATKTTSEPVPSTSTKVPVVPVLDVEPKIDPDGRLYNVEHPMLNPLVSLIDILIRKVFMSMLDGFIMFCF